MLKIGKTTQAVVKDRINQLYTTGAPVPFGCVNAVEVDDCADAEKTLHTACGPNRINPSREFSKIKSELLHHSNRGSQYTSKHYRQLLQSYGMRVSLGNVGAYWDNAVVERFFGSLKHDWLFKVHQPTRKHMKSDVAAYMKYYNSERLHSANSDETPVRLEQFYLTRTLIVKW